MDIFQIRDLFNPKDGTSISKLKEVLLQFKCQRDLDVQRFLHKDAIDFEIACRARTYLCVKDKEIIAYFTIAIRDLEISTSVSKSYKKRLTYGLQDNNHIPAYLIGQIAKCDTCDDKIGKQIIESSIEYIKHAKNYVGGRVVFLECKECLCKYYENLGFRYLQNNKDLKQMVQII